MHPPPALRSPAPPHVPASTDPLLAGYPSLAAQDAGDRFDELFDSPAAAAQGRARPAWAPLLAALRDTAPAQLQARAREVERMLRENGVTYNVYADPRGAARPWDLDLLPFVLSAGEWRGIEGAIMQRARLLDRVLADVYGEQRLLRDGALPAALVHGHRGFLRPCHGIANYRDTPLHLYAADLARAPDGRWWVIGDRTQGPTGAGYALENRLAISRAFPELFRGMRVQRLAGFFATLRDSLAARAPRRAPDGGASDEPPLIVLLTPGPYNETWTEQAFLARYLGFPLVVGNDLTVRDGFVWLKTLSGLQRVSVILRRLDDDFCDPLELRSDSALGVPGLTEAVRRGTVVIANNLGSGLLESGALLGYLPALAERLLGEPLKMPSVATWWCGEPAALEDAIARLDDLVIKPAFPQLRVSPVFGRDLDGAARDALVARMRERPHAFVAQESVHVSRAPVWRNADATLGASILGLRVYACALGDGRYAVMPGGLARVATDARQRAVTMQSGGASKDIWVLAEGSVESTTLLRSDDAPVHPVRGNERLASRTVENLFWFGRYAERVDDQARLLRRTLDTLFAASPEERGPDWLTMIALCRQAELLDAEVQPDDPEIQALLLEAVLGAPERGLPVLLRTFHDVASRLHERLSLDNWRVLNQMVQQLASPRRPATVDAATQRLDQAIQFSMTLSGFALDGMTRDLGWRFLSIGRRIERLQAMTQLLRHALSMPRTANLDWLLELGDSIATYRARYVSRAQWPLVLDLLVTDDTNPRAVAFQLAGLVGALDKIAFLDDGQTRDMLSPLAAELQALRSDGALVHGSRRLEAWLARTFEASGTLSDRLCLRFFSYAGNRSGG